MFFLIHLCVAGSASRRLRIQSDVEREKQAHFHFNNGNAPENTLGWSSLSLA